MDSHTRLPFLVRSFAGLVALTLAAALPACEADHSAPRTADFTRLTGELESYERANLDDTWNATLAAMDKLAFVVVQRDRSDVEALVMAKTQGGREVRIRISRETTIISRVRIRVDTLGDESLSRVILQQIQSELARSATAETPRR